MDGEALLSVGAVKPLHVWVFSASMRRADRRRHPHTQQEPTQRRGEILSRLGQEGDRGSCIDPHDRPRSPGFRLPCGLCSGETEPPSLKAIWISSNGSRRSLAWGDSLQRVSRQPVACRILKTRSTGAGQRDLCRLHLRITGKRAEHEAQAHAVCVLWRRKTHLHHALDHAHIPAEGGGMMRPPTRTPHRGVMGIIFCEPLAPFLHPTDSASCHAGSLLGGGLRVLSQQVAEKGTVSHPFFAPTSFPPQEKQTPSFSAPLSLRRWLLLIPCFAMSPPSKNSAVSMSLRRLGCR
jgi:hypothetical protein